mmetsp:Transcript_3722/g.9399  ORF Transcript_3722/g.9399 Transcript_3722/m.9399 type:complete len:205 (+) Transcript_3722:915-1529(+)
MNIRRTCVVRLIAFLQIGHCFFTRNDFRMHWWQKTCPQGVTAACLILSMHILHSSCAPPPFPLPSAGSLAAPAPLPDAAAKVGLGAGGFFLFFSFAKNTSGSGGPLSRAGARFFRTVLAVFTICRSKSAFLLRFVGLVRSTTSAAQVVLPLRATFARLPRWAFSRDAAAAPFARGAAWLQVGSSSSSSSTTTGTGVARIISTRN